ncbi:hypothetical protein LZ31DRAFT_556126 [Colletotrichum somersetense]|nr:hypothetical protein LZ31DRAFT_556126 [Colletotrichum somersetense]
MKSGTGIWVIAIGDKLPRAEIVRIGSGAVQLQWVPQNVKLEIDDAETLWVRNATYDFI